MRTAAGYGRYDDDVRHVGCPRARTDMTPCIARDGRLALSDGECVGCDRQASGLLLELLAALGHSAVIGGERPEEQMADDLRDLVREATEPKGA